MNNRDMSKPNEITILFLTEDDNMNRGSYRIWVKYLSESLIKNGNKVSICNISMIQSTDFDVIILDKGIKYEIINKFQNNRSRSIIGIINPSALTNHPVDFVIVGSREEEASLAHYRNVILVPLIELPIHNLLLKQHEDCNTLNICYHGNSLHLSSFKKSGLKKALENYNKKLISVGKNLVLNVITEKSIPKWLIGKPRVNTNYIKYNWRTFPSILVKQDIGIIPNSYFYKANKFSFLLKKFFNYEFDSTDYIMRMKNKSNYGRLMVFMQAGIPTICDITPSHLSLSLNSTIGYCASNAIGWIKAFDKLSNYKKRNEISFNAKRFVDENFNPEKIAIHFVEELNEIIAESNKIN